MDLYIEGNGEREKKETEREREREREREKDGEVGKTDSKNIQRYKHYYNLIAKQKYFGWF